MIQRRKEEVFGHFLELGLLDRLDNAYCDSTKCFPRLGNKFSLKTDWLNMPYIADKLKTLNRLSSFLGSVKYHALQCISVSLENGPQNDPLS